MHELYGNVGGMRLQGAAAAELCYVAAGRFEARIEGLLGPWDIAAEMCIRDRYRLLKFQERSTPPT